MSDVRLTDGGLETSLIYKQGLDLPDFAAFPLLESEEGRAALRRYYEPFLTAAAEQGRGFVMDTPTWRANPDWASALGYDAESLAAINRDAVAFAREVAGDAQGVVINGVVGPRGDGYVVEHAMGAAEAAEYHRQQIQALADGGADQVSAITMTYAEEATGFARAAQDAGLAHVVSFTVETDGRLPSGQALGDAIAQTDAATGASPRFFMVNCAHPTHFEGVLDEPWTARIGGIRANASTMSHAELDAAEELDEGDPDDLAARYRALSARLPNLQVVGGCCGTDHPHVRAIGAALAS
jgi:S-methylmethionine-dependent homocysteine/selenocysteine methylase